MKVFFQISIGNVNEYEQQCKEYELAKQYLAAVGEKMGFGSNIDKLDDTTKDSIKEMFESDPSWKSKGKIRMNPPESLDAGRIVMQLYPEESPKACENFKALCTGEKGQNKSGVTLHYKGSRIHRIEKGLVIQGGDITRRDGSGGVSIWGKPFNDDKGGLKLKHDSIGVLSMANSGKNSNTSQFFFTLGAVPKLDGKYVVFGKVIEGIEVLKKIEAVGSANSTPTVDVIVSDCGEL